MLNYEETGTDGASSPSGTSATATQRKRVLVIDDDQVFVMAATNRLEAAGFEVTSVSEPPQAITALGLAPVDVVLVDLNFPPDVASMTTWDGYMLLRWLRSLPNGANAVFIVASVSDPDVYFPQTQRLGACAFFQKPVDFDRLIQLINTGE